MVDIYDLSKNDIDAINMNTVAELGLAAIITILIDEKGQFVIRAAEGKGSIADKFRNGPPEIRGYEVIAKVLNAAAATIEKCIREGDANFKLMKP